LTAFVIGAKNGINVWLGGYQCYFGCLWVWAEEMKIFNYPNRCKTLFLDCKHLSCPVIL